MIKLNLYNNNIIAAFFIGCFFMLACENDVNVVKELGKKKPGIEEGKNITSYLSMGGQNESKTNRSAFVKIPRRQRAQI